VLPLDVFKATTFKVQSSTAFRARRMARDVRGGVHARAGGRLRRQGNQTEGHVMTKRLSSKSARQRRKRSAARATTKFTIQYFRKGKRTEPLRFDLLSFEQASWRESRVNFRTPRSIPSPSRPRTAGPRLGSIAKARGGKNGDEQWSRTPTDPTPRWACRCSMLASDISVGSSVETRSYRMHAHRHMSSTFAAQHHPHGR
jgi:hypothetical protein